MKYEAINIYEYDYEIAHIQCYFYKKNFSFYIRMKVANKFQQ